MVVEVLGVVLAVREWQWLAERVARRCWKVGQKLTHSRGEITQANREWGFGRVFKRLFFT